MKLAGSVPTAKNWIWPVNFNHNQGKFEKEKNEQATLHGDPTSWRHDEWTSAWLGTSPDTDPFWTAIFSIATASDVQQAGAASRARETWRREVRKKKPPGRVKRSRSSRLVYSSKLSRCPEKASILCWGCRKEKLSFPMPIINTCRNQASSNTDKSVRIIRLELSRLYFLCSCFVLIALNDTLFPILCVKDLGTTTTGVISTALSSVRLCVVWGPRFVMLVTGDFTVPLMSTWGDVCWTASTGLPRKRLVFMNVAY